MELADRVALVTGSARRVGRAIALRLAHSGAHVAIHFRHSLAEAEATAAACRAKGAQAATFQADLSDLTATQALPGAVVKQFGRLDILVNNASEFEPMTLDSFEPSAFERTMRVNLLAPLLLAHAARDELRRNSGRILNLCDVLTARPPPGKLAYYVSKGGLETLTRALARAFAPDVNVVGIAPGVADWPANYAPPQKQRILDTIPLRRAGTPEEIADLAHFVLTRGDYITGSIIAIDGGWHLR